MHKVFERLYTHDTKTTERNTTMGQYYRIAYRHLDGEAVINNRNVEGLGYIGAKLMEHSWLEGGLIMAVANEMYQHPMFLAWVGDYAENDEIIEATGGLDYKKVWEKQDYEHQLPKKDFDFTGKYLCNHSKACYISFDYYLRTSQADWRGATICPFSLLTAIGNGRGGGDYSSDINIQEVGTWAWDLISIEDTPPKGYDERFIFFKEDIRFMFRS